MNRRSFFLGGAAATTLGANDRIRGGIIGSGGRGRLLTAAFKELGVEMAAVCDIYEPNVQAGLQVASTGARQYDNYKRLLDDKSLDIVVIATPDHWHAQMTVDAVEAGKDVYLEKPMAHTIDDGFRIVEATRRTKRVVQVGTQRRSFPVFQEAKRIIDSGQAGEIRLVNSWWLNSTPRALSQPTLKGALDWKQWLGPAPKRPLDPVRFRNWYWFWDYSGGLLVGQAAHVVDAIQWFMNSPSPLAVSCSGKLAMEGAEVPETASLCIEYPEYLAVFTLGYKAMRYITFNDQLKQFHGSKARFDVGRESYALYPEDPKALEVKSTIDVRKPGSFNHAVIEHIRNLLDCVRSRKDPNATVEMGQATNIVLCMAMDSLRTGKRLRWNAGSRKVEA
ncbi:MAG TPA: Gfo/Idh/MocA family oxidoreductase [Bryobacteraceae bacterium]|nr:Gfo/Idh/MocA family oxidoreductase [Bryobacteraceae bacterium]